MWQRMGGGNAVDRDVKYVRLDNIMTRLIACECFSVWGVALCTVLHAYA
jgi:hypothetical protein